MRNRENAEIVPTQDGTAADKKAIVKALQKALEAGRPAVRYIPGAGPEYYRVVDYSAYYTQQLEKDGNHYTVHHSFSLRKKTDDGWISGTETYNITTVQKVLTPQIP